jgi:hypothetical protein
MVRENEFKAGNTSQWIFDVSDTHEVNDYPMKWWSLTVALATSKISTKSGIDTE